MRHSPQSRREVPARSVRSAIRLILVLLLGFGGVLAAPSAASADGLSTTTAFVAAAPVSIDFGGNWLITIKVTTNDYPVSLDSTFGTVDVYLSGINGAYASGLPLQPGGLAYFAQPSAKPPLAAGTYKVTAIFQPSAGGGLKTSQTATPTQITVAPIAANPTVVVVDDPSKASVPTITASFSGAYVQKNGGAPPGIWSFAVADSTGTKVFEAKVAQAAGSTKPLVIGIDKGIKQGTTYSVTSSFTPSPDVAAGIVLGKIADSSFQSADGSLGDKLAAPVALPLWLFIVIVVFLAALIAATIVFGRRVALAPKGPKAPTRPTPTTQPRFLAEPEPEELMSLSDVGLGNPPTQPIDSADAWSLSAETPTVAMDTPAFAQPPVTQIQAPQVPADAPTAKMDTPIAGFPFALTTTPPTELLDPHVSMPPRHVEPTIEPTAEHVDPTPTTTNPGASSD